MHKHYIQHQSQTYRPYCQEQQMQCLPLQMQNRKKSPEISPNLLGSSSCAYNRIAGKADESIKPTQKLRIIVHTSPACGINKLKGAVPRIDPQITYLRPILSPTGPPINVPMAVATRNTNKKSCDC